MHEPVTAPTSNWRFSGLLKICAGRKFSDILESSARSRQLLVAAKR